MICTLQVQTQPLRAILPYAAGKPLVADTTDIRQAFVLAPWKGEPVAVMPPKIAVDMARSNLYGLRESPKSWGDFLQQMTSDDQLWRVTQTTHLTDGSVSFLLVYVDDIFTVGDFKVMGGSWRP